MLGRPLARAAKLVEALQASDAPAHEITGYKGKLLFYQRELGASELLISAARLARESGEALAELRWSLFAARALAEVGRSASGLELLAPLRARIDAEAELYADLRMALAATGDPDARVLWEEALTRLRSPERDADRLEALLGLGVLARGGEDAPRARRAWEQALSIATAHSDGLSRLRLACLLGNALLEAGLPQEAEPRLREAVALAEALDEPLVLLGEATLLAALELGRQDWPAAEATAARIRAAARVRNNPLALVDAAITRSAARLGLGDTAGGVRALWDAATDLRERGNMAGLNLLRARLGELRVQLGPEVFDPLWMSIVQPRPAPRSEG